MKYKEIRELTDEELAKKLEEGRAELFNLRFQMATSQLDNTARVTNVKRECENRALHKVFKRYELAFGKGVGVNVFNSDLKGCVTYLVLTHCDKLTNALKVVFAVYVG